MPPHQDPKRDNAAARLFQPTQWSIVLLAADASTPDADAALNHLCKVYWWPLYAHVRRRGYEAYDAQDLTQEFFARLLSKHYLRAVDRNKGKFRSYLMAALDHFLANEWRNAHAQKRGGNYSFVSIDDESAEKPYLQIPTANLSPDQLFDQQWAITVVGQVVVKLREEHRADGKATQFESLKMFLTGEKRSKNYAGLAAKLKTTEAALKMAVSRMRRRYGELLRTEIANTVSDPAEIEQELRALFAALS